MKIKPVFIFFLFFLTSWKINLLLSAEGSESGIRLDDFVIIIMFFFIALHYKKLPQHTSLKYIYLFTITALVSSIYNNALSETNSLITSIFFSLRSLEYALFFFLGYYLIKDRKGDLSIVHSLLRFYFYYLVAIVLLQRFEVIGSISNFSSNDRLSGNLGGPWELAQISSFYCVYFLSNWNQNRLKSAAFLLTSFYLIIESGSRITLISTIISLTIMCLYLKIISKRHLFLVTALIITTLPILNFSVDKIQTSSIEQKTIISRYNDFFSSNLIADIQFFYNNTSDINTQEDFRIQDQQYIRSEINNFEGDASAYARFTRWVLASKAWANESILQIFIGNSPGYFGNALDGNYLRILFETGILGLTLFTAILFTTLSSFIKLHLIYGYRYISQNLHFSLILVFYTLSLSVTAIFIDILFTYKAMMLFWVLQGLAYAERRNHGNRTA